MTKFDIIEVTDRVNGYDMPIVVVKSSTELDIYNAGWNQFECRQKIDESNLLELRKLLPNHKKAHFEIHTPTRVTNCWYCLIQYDHAELESKYHKDTNNIIW